ncbi:MAG: Tyrosine recombinase XerC [Pelotomaculum sp. PtaB.Bin104]|nr:MAG: Tyrosine recombinase XerC [Pelotomaculum sp. PtaB.Bin104]
MTRRKKLLKPPAEQKVVMLSREALPDFEEAERLFYANEKAKNRLKRTIAWHRENINAFKKAMQEQGIELNLETITYRTIRNNLVLYAIEKWGNKPQTVNMRLRTLRQFFGFLVDEGYLAENPASKVERLKTAETLIVALNKEQVRRLLAVPDRKTFTGLRDYTIMLLLLDTGLRLSEISGMQMGDINFNENYIKVMGKGAKERTVPMQKKLKKVLKEYLLHRNNDAPDHDYVFITVDNNPTNNRGIQERIEIISKKAGVTEVRTSPHTWRHTFARMYILNGGDPFSLKKILGHNSWEMVHRYVNLFGSEVSSQHKKASPLENLFDD